MPQPVQAAIHVMPLPALLVDSSRCGAYGITRSSLALAGAGCRVFTWVRGWLWWSCSSMETCFPSRFSRSAMVLYSR